MPTSVRQKKKLFTNHYTQSVIDQNTNKPEEIERTKANLPLPDQPPTASDWNSLDQRTTGVGSGSVEFPPDNSGLREGAAATSSARVDGAQLHKNTVPTNTVANPAPEGSGRINADTTTR